MCTAAMFQPREKTFHELLRQTQKISSPRLSPVLEGIVCMQGPGVKEVCDICGILISGVELQQCSTCNRGFHTTCLDPPVETVVPSGVWRCGLCNESNCLQSQAKHEAGESTGGDCGTSSQSKSTSGFQGVKRAAHIRELRQVVQQEEAALLDSQFLGGVHNDDKVADEVHKEDANALGGNTKTSIAEGETPDSSRRSKRGRLLKGTGTVLPIKRRRADSGTARCLKVDTEHPKVISSNKEVIGPEVKGVSNIEEKAPRLLSLGIHEDANSNSSPQQIEAGERSGAPEAVREIDGASTSSVGGHTPGTSKIAGAGKVGSTSDASPSLSKSAIDDASINEAVESMAPHPECSGNTADEDDRRMNVNITGLRLDSLFQGVSESGQALQVVCDKEDTLKGSSGLMSLAETQDMDLAKNSEELGTQGPEGVHLGQAVEGRFQSTSSAASDWGEDLVVQKDNAKDTVTNSGDGSGQHKEGITFLDGPSAPRIAAAIAVDAGQPSQSLVDVASGDTFLQADVNNFPKLAGLKEAEVSDCDAGNVCMVSVKTKELSEKVEDPREVQETSEKAYPAFGEVAHEELLLVSPTKSITVDHAIEQQHQEVHIVLKEITAGKLPEEGILCLPHAQSSKGCQLATPETGLAIQERQAMKLMTPKAEEVLLVAKDVDVVVKNDTSFSQSEGLDPEAQACQEIDIGSKEKASPAVDSSFEQTGSEVIVRGILDPTPTQVAGYDAKAVIHSSEQTDADVGVHFKILDSTPTHVTAYVAPFKGKEGAVPPVLLHSPKQSPQQVGGEVMATAPFMSVDLGVHPHPSPMVLRPVENVQHNSVVSSSKDLIMSASPASVGVQSVKASTSVENHVKTQLESQLSKLDDELLHSPQSSLQAVTSVSALEASPAELISLSGGKVMGHLSESILSAIHVTKENNSTPLGGKLGPATEGSPKLQEDTSKLEGQIGPSTETENMPSEDEETGSRSGMLVEDVKVCDICGNSGYEEMLAVCSACNEGAEHIYCMQTQLDAVPEGDWFCETCRVKQKADGLKQTERMSTPAPALVRSTSVNSRQKPTLIQGNSRSRLSDRLNHKKPRGMPVRKSPSKGASGIQAPSKRPAVDVIASPVAKKLALDSGTGAPQASTGLVVRPSLTRENSFKGAPAKVKFLSPSALANFSPGIRVGTGKPPGLTVPSSKPGASQAGQASNRTRFVSLNKFSNEPGPTTVQGNQGFSNTPRTTLAAASTPTLCRTPGSGKLTVDYPSFLLSSRSGNTVKVPASSKMGRESSLEVSGQPQVRDSPSPVGQSIGGRSSSSMFLKMVKGPGSSSSPMDPRPWPDTPRPSVEYGRGAQRLGFSAEPPPPGAVVETDGPSISPPAGYMGSTGAPKVKHTADVVQTGLTSAVSNLEQQQGVIAPKQAMKQAEDSFSSLKTMPLRFASSQGISHQSLAVGMDNISAADMKAKETSDTAVKRDGRAAEDNEKPSSSKAANMEAQSKELERHLKIEKKFDRGVGMGVETGSVGTKLLPSPFVKQLANDNGRKSVPWLTTGSSSRCYKCKEVGHTAQACVNRASLICNLPELKATSAWASAGVSLGDAVSKETSVTLTPSFAPSPMALETTTASMHEMEFVTKEPPLQARSATNVTQLEGQLEEAQATTSSAAATGTGTQLLIPQYHTDPQQPSSAATPSSTVTDHLAAPPSASMSLVAVRGTLDASSVPLLGEQSSRSGLKTPNVQLKASDSYSPEAASVIPVKKVQKSDSPAESLKDNRLMPGNTAKPMPGHMMLPQEVGVRAPPSAMTIPPGGVPSWGPPSPWIGVDPLFAPGLPIGFPPGPSGYPPPPFGGFQAAPPPIAPPPYISPPLPDAAIPDDKIAWRGAFEVAEGQSTTLYDDIQARPSTRAVAKVLEVARGMPRRLQLEQVERSLPLETWPRQFIARPPTDGSIALYFFATDGERFRGGLVEHMVARDLVLRAQVDDAELLVFPSNQLPERFQRWNGHMFLWGVFRARKQPASLAVATTEGSGSVLLASSRLVSQAPTQARGISASGGDTMGEVDMEVDMEGGKECGVADRAVKRPKDKNVSPPAVPSTQTGPWLPSSVLMDCSDGKVKEGPQADLDIPPGFGPGHHKQVSAPVGPPGFEKKVEVAPQVGPGNSADVDTPDSGSSHLRRELSVVDHLRLPLSRQPSPIPSSGSPKDRREDASHHVSRASTRRLSRSSSQSPVRRKERDGDDRGREKGYERGKDRGKDREKIKDYDAGWRKDRGRDREWHSHRDRDRDRGGEWEKETSKDKDRSRERGKEKERERPLERDKGRGRDQWSKERERERESKLRHRRSRSRSRSPVRRSRSPVRRSRSPARRSRSPVRRRSPARRRGRSPSPLRRHFRHHSRSYSGSPDSRVKGSSRRGPQLDRVRSGRMEEENHLKKQRSFIDRDSRDKGSRLVSRARGSRDTHSVLPGSVEDARSESAGASNSRDVLKAEQSKAVDSTRTVTPVLDINEGVSSDLPRFSGAAARASTSLPDLNTQNDAVESVPFHVFLQADVAGPSGEQGMVSPISEQTFFPGARPTSIPCPSSKENVSVRDMLESSVAADRWDVVVGRSRSDYSERNSTGYQFIRTSETDAEDAYRDMHSNPDLELALGGQERTRVLSEPLPLFVQLLDGVGMHGCSASPELALAGLNGKERARSPDLRVGLSSLNHSRPSGTGASLSLSLAVPQYRREGNSWVKVEEERGPLGSDDVDFALTL